MAVAEYLPLKQLLPTALVSIFWGCLVFMKTFWGVLTKGPRKYFTIRKRLVKPDVLNDPELGTHHYARMKNIRLHYVSKGDEGRPLVLFLHGFPEFWYSWRYQLKEIGDKFRAVAVDMRGYGESDRPQGIAEYRMAKLTGDIKEFIEYLGYKKCFLVAHDWGGAVAWMFAAKYPDMVEKLITCNMVHPLAFRKQLQSQRSQMLKSWYMFFFQLPWFPEIFLGSQDLSFLTSIFTTRKVGIKPAYFNEDDLEAFKYTFQNFVDRNGPINYYRASLRFKPEQLPNTHVQAPTLIIWGVNDSALEKGMVEPSKKYVDNECAVRFIEDASHWVQQDSPELVNKYILEFIGE